FQAEDGIRDRTVTGVQTCALPILTQEEALFKPAKIDKKKLASALGLSPKDFDTKLEPELVSTGIFNLMVPLRHRAALGKITMNKIGRASCRERVYVTEADGALDSR